MNLKMTLTAMVLGATCLSAVPFAATAAETPAAGPPAAPPSPAAVVNMVNNCFSCHGTDGRSPGAIPSLTGKNADQALLMLKEFKSGQLASTVMNRHAKGYTDAELEAIAKYIANNLK
ncbi:MAG: c-type cytochrome [Sulfuricaulis sp.]|nr:c-type cytochrome [Sulfuricaulis sp.]